MHGWLKSYIQCYVHVMGTGYSLEEQSRSLKALIDSVWAVSARSWFQSTTVCGMKPYFKVSTSGWYDWRCLLRPLVTCRSCRLSYRRYLHEIGRTWGTGNLRVSMLHHWCCQIGLCCNCMIKFALNSFNIFPWCHTMCSHRTGASHSVNTI